MSQLAAKPLLSTCAEILYEFLEEKEQIQLSLVSKECFKKCLRAFHNALLYNPGAFLHRSPDSNFAVMRGSCLSECHCNRYFDRSRDYGENFREEAVNSVCLFLRGQSKRDVFVYSLHDGGCFQIFILALQIIKLEKIPHLKMMDAFFEEEAGQKCFNELKRRVQRVCPSATVEMIPLGSESRTPLTTFFPHMGLYGEAVGRSHPPIDVLFLFDPGKGQRLLGPEQLNQLKKLNSHFVSVFAQLIENRVVIPSSEEGVTVPEIVLEVSEFDPKKKEIRSIQQLKETICPLM